MYDISGNLVGNVIWVLLELAAVFLSSWSKLMDDGKG